MNFTTLAIVNSVLTSIEVGAREGRKVDAGVLGSFNAGISHLLLSGREPSQAEVKALQDLASAVVEQPSEGEASEPADGEAATSAPAEPEQLTEVHSDPLPEAEPADGA